jgi:hypothetical protein
MTNREELQQQLAALQERRAALAAELKELLVRVRQSRSIVGNPFYYSHPKHPDESIANYTGYSSLAVTRPTFWKLWQVEEEIARLRAALNDVPEPDPQ